MKPIEGIDLAEVTSEVRAELLSEQRRAIAKIVNGIYANIGMWQKQLDEARRTVEKRTQQISAAQDKLTKIMAGDWSILKEEKKDDKKEATPGDDD